MNLLIPPNGALKSGFDKHAEFTRSLLCERRRRRSTGLAFSKPYSGVDGRFGHKMAGGFSAAGDGDV
jgi:hypothetical protein